MGFNGWLGRDFNEVELAAEDGVSLTIAGETGVAAILQVASVELHFELDEEVVGYTGSDGLARGGLTEQAGKDALQVGGKGIWEA